MEEKEFKQIEEGIDEIIKEVESIGEIIDRYVALIELKREKYETLTEQQKIIIRSKELKLERLINCIKDL